MPYAIITVLFIVGMFVLVFVAIRAEKERLRKRALAMTEYCESRSLKPVEVTPGTAASLAPLFPSLTYFRSHTACVKFLAEGMISSRAAKLLDIQYTVSSGKSSSTFCYGIVALDVGFPMPGLQVFRETFIEKMTEFMGYRDFKVGEESFDKAYRVNGENETFALSALSYTEQEMLMGVNGITILTQGPLLVVHRQEPCTPDKFDELTLIATRMVDRIQRTGRMSF